MAAAATVAAEGGGEQWLCQIYSGRLQIMLSCRWMADKHGGLRFLTGTDRRKPRTASSACEAEVRARRWAPLQTHNAPGDEDGSFDLSTTHPELTGFGRAIHQTERRLGAQGGLLDRDHAACCPFIEGNFITDE